MDSKTLRHVWSLIEKTQSHTLLDLDDSHLVQCLTEQLREQRSLNGEQTAAASQYIRSRCLLIRDLALSRQTH
jgi:hypothetical protein